MRKMNKYEINKAIALYKGGHTQKEIAKILGFHLRTIVAKLRASGIVGRRNHELVGKEKIKKILELYDAGHSQQYIQKNLGVDWKTTNKYLKKYGRKLRPKAYYSAGERNPAWKGGIQIDKNGYVLVFSPKHPYRNKQNRVREHRLVMESHIGRFLRPGEVVDHINGIKNDNRIENLRLFSSNAEHLKTTLAGKVPKWSEDGKNRIVKAVLRAHKRNRSKTCDCGSHKLCDCHLKNAA